MPDLTRVTRFNTIFRLGSTSYVYPDDLLPNVQKLAQAGDVDDIELVLFEVDDGPNNLPDDKTVAALIDLAATHHLTYTVHLPLDLRLGADGSTQHASLLKAERVIKTTLPLTPWAYVFHLDGSDAMTPGWVKRSLSALERVIAWAPRPELLAVENVEAWEPALLEPILKALPISRATDIGHLWKMGRDPLSVLDGWLPRTRVIHLHGLGERDHQNLGLMSAQQLDPVIDRLRNYAGVLTLEVFSTGDFFDSRAALLESVKRVSRG